MHACMAYLLALKHQKMCLSRASRTCATSQKNSKVEISSPRKNHVLLSFSFCPERGCFTGRWGIGMYEMTVICLDGSKKKMQAFFFSSIFYEMVYEMRETHGKKKWAAGRNFYGEIKAWRVGLVGRGTSHYLLPPRYKVCKRERGFIFILLLLLFIFVFSFQKASIRY